MSEAVIGKLPVESWNTTVTQHMLFQVPEAQLIRFLGGQLGAKAAAVETLIKNLPKVLHALRVPLSGVS